MSFGSSHRAARKPASRPSRAQALVEFALILPVMILILLVAVDFGRLFFSYTQITNAAREGAAYGISNPNDNAGINARAQQETNVQTQTNGSAGTLTVTTACSPQTCAAAATSGTQNVVTVTVTQPFTFLTPVIGNVVGTMTLKSSASSVALGQAGVAITPTPCTNVPNVVNLTPSAANSALISAGLVPNGIGDVTTGAPNSVRTQSPAAGTCVTPGSTLVTYHYRP